MNALQEIERQLRVSVTARTADAGASPADGPAAARRRRPWQVIAVRERPRPAQLAVGVGTIVAVSVVLALVSVGPASGPSPAVAAVLQRLARIAASGPSLVPSPGQYLYSSSLGRGAAFGGDGGPKECISYSTDHRQVWMGADGSGLLRERSGPNTFTSQSDRAVCASMRMTQTTRSGTSNLWFANDCFELGPGGDINALSKNPRTLLRQMRRIDGGPRDAAEDFVHVGDFLRETDASPTLRAALYRAAALIPGVHLLGRVRDHIGRLGLGVTMTVHHVRNELIFNPRTAALLAEQTTGRTPGSTTWTVYLSSRVVTAVPYPSPVPLTSPCHHGMGYMHRVAGGTVMSGRRIR